MEINGNQLKFSIVIFVMYLYTNWYFTWPYRWNWIFIQIFIKHLTRILSFKFSEKMGKYIQFYPEFHMKQRVKINFSSSWKLIFNLCWLQNESDRNHYFLCLYQKDGRPPRGPALAPVFNIFKRCAWHSLLR